MVIWKAQRFEYDFYGIPGHIGLILDGNVIVACGDNSALVLEEIEYDGYRGNPNTIIKSISDFFD